MTPLRFEVGDRCRLPNGKVGRVDWISPTRKNAIVAVAGDSDGHLVELAKLDLALPRSAEEGT